MTLSIKGLYVTLSISDTYLVTFSITMICHYVERHYAECRILFMIMLNVTNAKCRNAECRYAECRGAL